VSRDALHRAARLAACAACALLGLGGDPGAAFAHGTGAYAQAKTPPSPPGDGAKAEELLGTIEAQVKGTEREPIVREALAQARRALERAHGARTSGDEAHAALLAALALDWARAANAQLTAANVERSADAAAKEAEQVATKVERARALLAESQAQRGVVVAELARLEAEAQARKDAAAATEAARLRGAKGEPAKPAPGAKPVPAEPKGGSKKP